MHKIWNWCEKSLFEYFL